MRPFSEWYLNYNVSTFVTSHVWLYHTTVFPRFELPKLQVALHPDLSVAKLLQLCKLLENLLHFIPYSLLLRVQLLEVGVVDTAGLVDAAGELV